MTTYSHDIAIKEFQQKLLSLYIHDESNPDNFEEDLDYWLQLKHIDDLNSIICSYGIGKAIRLHNDTCGSVIDADRNVELSLAFLIIKEWFDDEILDECLIID